MPAADASAREALRILLKARGLGILAELLATGGLPAHAVTARSRSRNAGVVIIVGPLEELRDSGGSTGQSGQWLSPIEAAIWHCLGSETLQGKQIATRISQPYGPALKTLLRNLVERGILCWEKAEGYRRVAGNPPTGNVG